MRQVPRLQSPAWLGRTPQKRPDVPLLGARLRPPRRLGHLSGLPRKPPALPGPPGSPGSPAATRAPRPGAACGAMCRRQPFPRQAGKFSGEVGTATNRVYKNTSKLSRSARTGAKTGKSFEGGAGGCSASASGGMRGRRAGLERAVRGGQEPVCGCQGWRGGGRAAAAAGRGYGSRRASERVLREGVGGAVGVGVRRLGTQGRGWGSPQRRAECRKAGDGRTDAHLCPPAPR